MKAFMYTVKNPNGLHSRHAGLLVKEAGKYQSDITVIKGESMASAKHILRLMNLGVKQGDVITFVIEGTDEEEAALILKKLVQECF